MPATRDNDINSIPAVRNLVVPGAEVLAGTHAIRAVARWIAECGVVVREYYTSNVED